MNPPEAVSGRSILVKVKDGTSFQPQAYPPYSEVWKEGPDAEIGQKRTPLNPPEAVSGRSILVKVKDGTSFQPQAYPPYSEDWKEGPDAEIGQKGTP
ncbi:MAG: hypothetical protein GY702_28850 [Desulfobulbaceae bacterium]|nr:hypothetical protein [Desulfobulbaceae bacterium]